MQNMVLRTTDSEQTQAIGACLAVHRPSHAMVYLEGDLGAGKTTLVRGFIQACGHKGNVKSPTYTLVEPYEFSQGPIHHFDLYRLKDPEELEFIGARELLATGICLIEWPSQGSSYLPKADIHLALRSEAQTRHLLVEAYTTLGNDWLVRARICLSPFLTD